MKSIAYLTKDKTMEEIVDFIGVIAISTGVPIIIVGHYLAELYGYTPELIDIINKLKKFYTVSETIGLTCGKDPTMV